MSAVRRASQVYETKLREHSGPEQKNGDMLDEDGSQAIADFLRVDFEEANEASNAVARTFIRWVERKGDRTDQPGAREIDAQAIHDAITGVWLSGLATGVLHERERVAAE